MSKMIKNSSFDWIFFVKKKKKKKTYQANWLTTNTSNKKKMQDERKGKHVFYMYKVEKKIRIVFGSSNMPIFYLRLRPLI